MTGACELEGPVTGGLPIEVLSPGRVAVMERTIEAIEMRKRGLTWSSIAKKLGWADPTGPRKAVRIYLENQLNEGIIEMRAIENERLDALLEALWDRAVAGELDVVDRVLRIAQRRATLNGLDAPVKVDVAGEVVTYHLVGVPIEAV